MTTKGQTSRALVSPGAELTAAILSRQGQPAAGLGAELCGLTSPQTTVSNGLPCLRGVSPARGHGARKRGQG